MVRERRNGLTTCTAMRSPTRPMRPSLKLKSPQRMVTLSSWRASKTRVSPTCKFDMRRIGNLVSCKIMSTLAFACQIPFH